MKDMRGMDRDGETHALPSFAEQQLLLAFDAG